MGIETQTRSSRSPVDKPGSSSSTPTPTASNSNYSPSAANAGNNSNNVIKGSGMTQLIRTKLRFTDETLWKRFSARRLELIDTLSLSERKASEQDASIREVAYTLLQEYGYDESTIPDFEKLVRAGIQSVRRNRKRMPKSKLASTPNGTLGSGNLGINSSIGTASGMQNSGLYMGNSQQQAQAFLHYHPRNNNISKISGISPDSKNHHQQQRRFMGHVPIAPSMNNMGNGMSNLNNLNSMSNMNNLGSRKKQLENPVSNFRGFHRQPYSRSAVNDSKQLQLPKLGKKGQHNNLLGSGGFGNVSGTGSGGGGGGGGGGGVANGNELMLESLQGRMSISSLVTPQPLQAQQKHSNQGNVSGAHGNNANHGGHNTAPSSSSASSSHNPHLISSTASLTVPLILTPTLAAPLALRTITKFVSLLDTYSSSADMSSSSSTPSPFYPSNAASSSFESLGASVLETAAFYAVSRNPRDIQFPLQTVHGLLLDQQVLAQVAAVLPSIVNSEDEEMMMMMAATANNTSTSFSDSDSNSNSNFKKQEIDHDGDVEFDRDDLDEHHENENLQQKEERETHQQQRQQRQQHQKESKEQEREREQERVSQSQMLMRRMLSALLTKISLCVHDRGFDSVIFMFCEIFEQILAVTCEPLPSMYNSNEQVDEDEEEEEEEENDNGDEGERKENEERGSNGRNRGGHKGNRSRRTRSSTLDDNDVGDEEDNNDDDICSSSFEKESLSSDIRAMSGLTFKDENSARMQSHGSSSGSNTGSRSGSILNEQKLNGSGLMSSQSLDSIHSSHNLFTLTAAAASVSNSSNTKANSINPGNTPNNNTPTHLQKQLIPVSLKFASQVLHFTYNPDTSTPPTVSEIIDNSRSAFHGLRDSHCRDVQPHIRDLSNNRLIDTDAQLESVYCNRTRIDLELEYPKIEGNAKTVYNYAGQDSNAIHDAHGNLLHDNGIRNGDDGNGDSDGDEYMGIEKS